MNPAVFVPVIVVAAAFVAFCWYDISRQPATRHLPRWAWGIVCIASVPLGGFVYLLVGRDAPTTLTDDDL